MTISWLVCLLALPGGASGEVPTSLSAFVAQPTLDEGDKSEIREYTAYYLDLLARGDHDDVMKARTKLVEPMQNIRGQASSAFRSAYAADLIPSLETILDEGDVYRGVNAIQIAGFLGTDSSIRMLGQRASSLDEPDYTKRLWVAIAIRKSMTNGELSLRSFNAAVRALADAAESEDDWRVLMRQLESVSSIARSRRSQDEGGEDLRAIGRKLQLRMIKSTLDRILSGEGGIELIRALRPSIFDVQQQYLDPELIRYRREVGLNMAPQLARVYDVILLHHESLQGNEKLKESSGLSLRLSDETLRLIDGDYANAQRDLPYPNLNLENPWLNNKDDLRKAKEAWDEMHSRPPYTGR
ncbi:MAG: hypothetical protein VX908_08110 [Planctomycetota bacterium]|nr:hypothetical protein [Planctomycetota bacterium]